MRCDRCKEEIKGFFKMSFFNTENICSKCIEIEESHPLYDYAREVERVETFEKGNRNFEGIGLPSDYHEFAKNFNK